MASEARLLHDAMFLQGASNTLDKTESVIPHPDTKVFAPAARRSMSPVCSSRMTPAEWIPFLHELADRSDEIARRYFRAGDLHVERKADRSLVTRADLEIEETVRRSLERAYPELGVFGEELGEDAPKEAGRLIVDPIDGTANFARGIPIFGTLLALEIGGGVVAAVVSAPALAGRWHAFVGGGAWSGDRRLRVSGVRDLADAQAFHGSLAGSEALPESDKLYALLARTHRQRGLGDFYQHVLVAEGCGEMALDPSAVKPWDIAPLRLLVEEAGGRATSIRGEATIYGGSLISTNGCVHQAVLEAFA